LGVCSQKQDSINLIFVSINKKITKNYGYNHKNMLIFYIYNQKRL